MSETSTGITLRDMTATLRNNSLLGYEFVTIPAGTTVRVTEPHTGKYRITTGLGLRLGDGLTWAQVAERVQAA